MATFKQEKNDAGTSIENDASVTWLYFIGTIEFACLTISLYRG